MAEIVGIWRAPAHGEPMESLDAAQAVENHGLEGCAHARPGGKRQVLFVAAEDLEAVDVDPGVIRENLTVRGCDVMRWPIGQRLTAGDAEFEITMVCDPCELMETIRPGLQAELEGRRGMLATVVKGGDVAIGAEVVLLPVASPSL
jgi:MOSC domain-containing protein YiiM